MNRTRIEHAPPETLFHEPLPRWKRSMDVAGALVSLIVFSPLLIGVAILIRMTSPGSVLFKQERIGYLGRRFTMLKFRTMHMNGDQNDHQSHVVALIRDDAEKTGRQHGRAMKKIQNDGRIIRGGNFLRKAHLDELPQLLNVLRGDMSLVGPRPPIGYEVQAYDQWHAARLDAVPGMTGLWQVSGKNQTTFREMVRLDIRYARERSLVLDIRILLLTCVMFASQIIGLREEEGVGSKGAQMVRRN